MDGSGMAATYSQHLAALFLSFITAEEADKIYAQILHACIPNRQVLWSGMLREDAQHWADKHGMQTLTTAMGPLMDVNSPHCCRRKKSPSKWSMYVHGASVLFAWYIASGDVVTVLSQPPPQRFNPTGEAYYQTIEEPIITGKLCNRHVRQIIVVHPGIDGAQDFLYEMWPEDHWADWINAFGTSHQCCNWRRTRLTKAIRDLKVKFSPVNALKAPQQVSGKPPVRNATKNKTVEAKPQKKADIPNINSLTQTRIAQKSKKKKKKKKKKTEEEENKNRAANGIMEEEITMKTLKKMTSRKSKRSKQSTQSKP